MHLYTCPFCGQRPETEFHFGGEAGNDRPDGEVPAQVWADYLHYRQNPKGTAREIWIHLTCGEVFAMTRDTVTMAAQPGEPVLSGLSDPSDRGDA